MSEPSTSLPERLARIKVRLEEIRKAEGIDKSEDFIDPKHANDPDKRLKNVGGEGLDSMPKAGKATGKDEGSGGDVKKGKGLGKGEIACGACNGGKVVKKGEPCKSCGGAGKVMAKAWPSLPSMPQAVAKKPEPQQTGGQKNTAPVVTEGLKTPGGKSPAYQHQGAAAHSSDKPKMAKAWPSLPSMGGAAAPKPAPKPEKPPVKKDEVPAAKPPSGKMPGAAPKPPTTGAPKVGGAPGGAAPGGLPKPAGMAKPATGAMGKEEMAPGAPAKVGTLLPKTKVVSGGQAMSGTAQRLYRQHQQQQMRTRFNALRDKAIKDAGVNKSELVSGAAHHLNGLNAAILRKDDGVAQQHARLCVVYERLLGYEPSAVVPAEIEAAASGLAKGEPATAYRAFARDQVAEGLFKNILGALGTWANHAAPIDTVMAAAGRKSASSIPGRRDRDVHLPGVSHSPTMNLGIKGGIGGQSTVHAAPHMNTSRGQWAAAKDLKPAETMDFGQSAKSLPKPGAAAAPAKPNAAGSVLARIRQKVFGSKSAAAAPASASQASAFSGADQDWFAGKTPVANNTPATPTTKVSQAKSKSLTRGMANRFGKNEPGQD